MELKGKRALVMGLGLHDGGLGVTRFLAEQGATVTVTDLRSPAVLAPTLQKLQAYPVRYVLGEHRESDFQQADLVVRNPAVPRESRFLQLARQAGASIEMEMTLFFKLCPSKLILGITGTRGKTSTTVLAGAMLKAWQPETVVAGNLRISALEKLPQISPTTPVVLELSSWQLEGLGEQQLSPRFAAVTNLSPDHLNRYRDMADYAEAKRNIVRWQDRTGVAVLNYDAPLVRAFASGAGGRSQFFSLAQPVECYTANGNFHWRDSLGQPQSCPTSLLKVPGQHNQANALAAIGLVSAAGCPSAAIAQGLADFTGVADRLEFVREVAQVRYYNDTTATSPAGTLVALQAFEQDAGQIVLLAGGADKQLEFGELAATVAEFARTGRLKQIVLLAGTATPRLVAALEAVGTPAIYGLAFDNFKAAVLAAKEAAAPGDIVLLSPGCASFGMFLHEFERGEQFRQILKAFV